MRRGILGVVFVFLGSLAVGAVEPPKLDAARGDRLVAEYFRQETAALADSCLRDIRTLDDWQAKRGEYRRQLLEMLGLDPPPDRTDLCAQVTGNAEGDGFVVENIHFQSRPGLYVTGNLYRPKDVSQPCPAILYLCGHGAVKKDGVSYGNKVHYQHHGEWFARHGYVCLTIDSLQLGEIEGLHHGTHRLNMWWWLSRGYTPAGVEAWNCMRALDYLQSRSDVDPERIGCTGRSGGGAYSWWIAALDERIKVAVPVAGITDLQNHVVDGCVEGHCDCMFMLNTYRWDYPLVAALVAPRPVLISNTDRDGIFPLDGVYRTYQKVRRVYELYKASDKVALNITAGGHADTQELQMHAFRWFDEHLKGEKRVIEKAATKFLEPDQLRVFRELPADQQNTQIQESFVAAPPSPALPVDKLNWEKQRESWRKQLLDRSFRGWPKLDESLNPHVAFDVERHGIRFRAVDFTSQAPFRLRLYVAHRTGLEKPEWTELNVLDAAAWNEFLAAMRPGFEEELKSESLPNGDAQAFERIQKLLASSAGAWAYFAPRGIGPTAWDQTDKKQIQNRRRFYLLGQTWEGMQTWDVRRAMQTVRAVPGLADAPLRVQSQQTMGGVALLASLFEPPVQRLDLHTLPSSFRDGPTVLNIERILEVPHAVAMAVERFPVILYQNDDRGWEFPTAVARLTAAKDRQFQIRAAN